ncbi:MAG: SDR family oxidoreductase [Gammaproteobacteria bacterium]|nr:SDR family oxidoreductase [Gammaproteobacteria bacterium]MDH3535828.1 SDR family oxidoreductase [Gammaproteobacteria bacterium]
MTIRAILITGANRGIGLELSGQFAEDGWQVIACCRNPADAGQLQALAERNPTIEIHALDVTDYEQLATLAGELGDRPIDILLSNAGIYGPSGVSFGKVDAAEWREVLEVNTIAPLMLAQALVEQVAASQQKLIAVISSKVGSIADNSSGGSYLYRSSKTAVNQVVKCLSIDLAERGISAISLHPGWVQTDMGGPNAEIDTDTSVSGLKSILQSAGPAQNGQFIEYNGNIIPW